MLSAAALFSFDSVMIVNLSLSFIFDHLMTPARKRNSRARFIACLTLVLGALPEEL